MNEGARDITIGSPFLQRCDIEPEKGEIEPFTLVIFGGTGDLSRRKLLPALWSLCSDGEMKSAFSVIGIGRAAHDNEWYRRFARDALAEFSEVPVDEESWADFASCLHFHIMDLKSDASYASLTEKIKAVGPRDKKSELNVIYYLAVPPDLAPDIVDRLRRNLMCASAFNTRIIVEKPFGTDQRSAAALNSILLQAFKEEQIYRIDHYLGKETVQNIIFFRFSNSIFEPLWNRRYIDNIQITAAEDIGIEHRGGYYEEAGVVRDMVQNHIMQIIASIAMEPPVGFVADYVRDERVKVFRTFRPMDEAYIDANMVRGQYGPGIVNGKPVPAYREEDKVPPKSNIPTFIAAKLYIDTWRWAGVPFFIRTGKRLARRVTEIAVQFRQPPLKLFGRTCDVLEPNIVVITIQPAQEIRLRFGIKYPDMSNAIYRVEMDFNYDETFRTRQRPPYERLLIDCMKGDLTLFARQDGIEAMWSAVDPVIRRWEENPAPEFPNYAAGSWGPDAARLLLEREGYKWITG